MYIPPPPSSSQQPSELQTQRPQVMQASGRPSKPQFPQSISASGKPGKPLSRQSQPKIIDKIIRLPGIEFPADRSKIIKEAEKSTTPKETRYLKFISNKKYNNESDLENELNIENTTKEGQTVRFKIINEKLRGEEESKVIS
jgi:hypothetical protein